MKPEEAIEILEAASLVEECMIEHDSEMDKEIFDCDASFNGRKKKALDTAIEALKEVRQYREIGTVEECREAVEKVASLKSYVEQLRWERDIAVQQLEEIGVSMGEKMDAVKEAVEKQKPKKIYHEKWNGIDGVPYDLCPTCKKNLCTTGMLARHKMSYCENCGQKLCWNENLEGMEDE